MFTHLPSWKRALRLTYTRRPFRIWFALWSPLIMATIAFFYTLVLIGRIFDRVFFMDYKHQKIEKPIYIVANMRSGTTFLHRMLEHDPQFSTLKLFNTLFPAVSYYYFFGAFTKIDDLVGRPIKRLIGLIENLFFKHWQGIHATGFSASEEDEMYWLYAGLSPAMCMFYPFPEFDDAMFPDRMHGIARQKISEYYGDNIRRHVYATRGKKMLAKNALIAGRIEIAYENMPDMQIVHLVRTPFEVIPSKISMFAAVWKLGEPTISVNSEIAKYIADTTIEYYLAFDRFAQTLPPDQYLFLTYEELISNPRAAIDKVYDCFGLESSKELRAQYDKMCQQSKTYQSTHKYSLEQYGIDEDYIYGKLRTLFDKYGWDAPAA